MNVLGRIHHSFIHPRRVERLASSLEPHIPHGSSVLDIGCGDGQLAKTLLRSRPDLSIRGLDVMLRESSQIAVELFDGVRIPAEDNSYDIALLVDVLHHTDDPQVLLSEAARVARRGVLLKDHLNDGWLSGHVLRLMDWVGNSPSGVRLPYNYLTSAQWRVAFERSGLRLQFWSQNVGLYFWPASLIFDRSLHVIAALTPLPHGYTRPAPEPSR
jgi:SAM-dependent methyltransferase